MISLQMLFELEEQEIVRRRKIRMYAGWGRTGSFSCAKASWVWRLVCGRALSCCSIESLPLRTRLSLTLRVLSVEIYFLEFTVCPCFSNSMSTTPFMSQKMVKRTFLADAITLNFLGLGDVLCRYTIAYSPDLAPSDYFLYLQLKKQLKGNHYDSDEEVIAAIRQWCREQLTEFFADGIRQLVRRWQLCIDRDGDYVEKWNTRCVAEVSSFNLM